VKDNYLYQIKAHYFINTVLKNHTLCHITVYRIVKFIQRTYACTIEGVSQHKRPSMR
jgi:hypothetical protein